MKKHGYVVGGELIYMVVFFVCLMAGGSALRFGLFVSRFWPGGGPSMHVRCEPEKKRGTQTLGYSHHYQLLQQQQIRPPVLI